MNDPIPEAIATIKKLEKSGKKIAYFTNNSSKTPAAFQEKLQRMGLSVTPEQIFTSSIIAAETLKDNYSGAVIYTVGEEGLNENLEVYGYTILNHQDPAIESTEYLSENQRADIVLVGWDTNVTYGKLRSAMMLILEGAEFYATNDDASYPVPGTLWPGAGANVAFLSCALGKDPKTIFGKPHSEGFQTILNYYDVNANQAVMVGDRIETDIYGGNLVNMTTIAVATGVHKPEDLSKFPPEYHPDYFYRSLADWWKSS
jgi:HAD superfamily hydrolase (TIGR01450 family)